MDITKRKINKITDELITFLFSVGADDIHVGVKKLPEGYKIEITSNFKAAYQPRVEKLRRILNPTDRYEGLEDFYWELAGDSHEGQDSELLLVGHMIDEMALIIEENRLHMTLLKKEHQ